MAGLLNLSMTTSKKVFVDMKSMTETPPLREKTIHIDSEPVSAKG